MSRYQPALLGGLFIGVLSALPIVNTANLCCCLWVVVGGGLTTYLLQQARPEPVEASEAAIFGLIAGLVGGVLYVAATAVLLSGALGAQFVDQLREAMGNNPEIPAEVRDRMIDLTGSGALALIVAAVTIPTYAVFSMAGALIGVALFRKKVLPPPTTGPTFTP
jgi:hypothetical protein